MPNILGGHDLTRLQTLVMRHSDLVVASAKDTWLAYLEDDDIKPAEMVAAMLWTKALDVAALGNGPFAKVYPVTLDEVIEAVRLAWTVGR